MRKPKKEVPPLGAAVKRVREKYGESQEQFGKRVALALMTISRFERGAAVPSNIGVLAKLAVAAHEKGLTAEAKLFERAKQEQERERELAGLEKRTTTTVDRWRMEQQHSRIYPGRYMLALPQWRLMTIAFIASVYYPETAASMEKAAEGPVAELVDEALRLADTESQTGSAMYEEVERIVRRLAEQRALERYRRKENQDQQDRENQ